MNEDKKSKALSITVLLSILISLLASAAGSYSENFWWPFAVYSLILVVLLLVRAYFVDLVEPVGKGFISQEDKLKQERNKGTNNGKAKFTTVVILVLAAIHVTWAAGNILLMIAKSESINLFN